MQGIDFFETNAPVVQWTTIYLMLIPEVFLELKSKQGNITAAFFHANLKEEENVFVEMRLGFQKKDKGLMLKKTLYNLCKASHTF